MVYFSILGRFGPRRRRRGVGERGRGDGVDARLTRPPHAVFGTKDKFTKYYEGPILRGREPDATDKQKKLGKARQKELSDLSDHFIIRRMNRLNAEHLPPKLTQVVCCKLTPTQQRMYEHVVRKRDRVAATQGHVKDTLGVIQRLQKICNHPSLAT